MGAFYQATQDLERQNQVTSFTMSTSRAHFKPNSNNRTDHGWDGYQIVFGGSLKGGKTYGDFQTQAPLGGPNDLGINGRWIPTTYSAQFAATLASWFGIPHADCPSSSRSRETLRIAPTNGDVRVTVTETELAAEQVKLQEQQRAFGSHAWNNLVR